MSIKGKIIICILKGGPNDPVRRKLFIWKGKKELDKIWEGNEMETKEWYRSKTVWTAIVAAILGAVQPVSAALGHPIAIPAYVYEVLAGFGLYSLRASQGTPLK